jgi:hypothetical protein
MSQAETWTCPLSFVDRWSLVQNRWWRTGKEQPNRLVVSSDLTVEGHSTEDPAAVRAPVIPA